MAAARQHVDEGDLNFVFKRLGERGKEAELVKKKNDHVIEPFLEQLTEYFMFFRFLTDHKLFYDFLKNVYLTTVAKYFKVALDSVCMVFAFVTDFKHVCVFAIGTRRMCLSGCYVFFLF